MIKTTSDLVHEILKTEPECRNSDNILYLRVLQIIGKQNGIVAHHPYHFVHDVALRQCGNGCKTKEEGA